MTIAQEKTEASDVVYQTGSVGGDIRLCARDLLTIGAREKQLWSDLRWLVAQCSEQVFAGLRAEVAKRNDPHQTYFWLRSHLHVDAHGEVTVTVDDLPCQAPWKRAEGLVVVVHSCGETFEWVELPIPEWARDHDERAVEAEQAAGCRPSPAGIPF